MRAGERSRVLASHHASYCFRECCGCCVKNLVRWLHESLTRKLGELCSSDVVALEILNGRVGVGGECFNPFYDIICCPGVVAFGFPRHVLKWEKERKRRKRREKKEKIDF